MGAGELVEPAIADVELAIVGAGAISDDEVVSEAVEVSGLMFGGDGCRGAVVGAGVVDDDAIPALGFEVGAGLEDGFDGCCAGGCDGGCEGEAIERGGGLTFEGEEDASDAGHCGEE